jgi:hypothetical protein
MKLTGLCLASLLVKIGLAGGPESPKAAPAASPLVKAAARPAIDPDRVYFDAPGDGAVWARTERYKARFGPEGASFIPFLGSGAPRNFPLTLSLESITAGGQPFLSAAPAAPLRQGNAAVVYDRGAVLERYDLRADSMEQSFVLAALPAAGDLVVRIRVETEMQAAPAGPETVDYVAAGWGRVRVSEAVVFDAAGRRAALEIAHEPGALELRVPAVFLDGAALPVTVDPVFRAFPVAAVGADHFAADTTSNGFVWMVCFERAFSATDHDVWAQVHDRDGTLLAGSGDYIDYTTAWWSRPRAAFTPEVNCFFVVATVGLPTANDRAVWGRQRLASPPAQGLQLRIAGGRSDDRAWDADVGGTWFFGVSRGFIVVYTQAGADGQTRVFANVRDVVGNPFNLVIAVSNSGSPHSPAISKMTGVDPSATARWSIVWMEDAPVGSRIRMLQLDLFMNMITQPFTVTSGLGIGAPRVSTVNGDAGDGRRPCLVVWEYSLLAGVRTDVLGAVYDGATRLAFANLSELENVARNEDQIHPAVDGDGCRFVVAYAESYQGSATDYDIYCSTFHYDAGAIGVTEPHVNLDYASTREDRPAVAAGEIGLLGRPRHLVVWDSAVTATDHDIRGALYDAHGAVGGHATVPTGCGGLTISATGVPALGVTVTYSVGGGAGVPYLIVGIPVAPVALCSGCSVGVYLDNAVFLPGVIDFELPIPCVPFLLGQSFAVQGASVGMAGGCPAPLTLTLSDTIVSTVQ